MQLTEQHIIDRSDPRYEVIDKAAFASKNLYNATLYIVRQIFILEGEYLNCNTMDQVMQKHEAYRGLPTKVAQGVVKQVHVAWVSFFEACKEYREHPEKFTGRPRLPGYKDKASGRNLLQYNMQAVSRGKRTLDRGIIKPSQLGMTVKTKQDPKAINEVRIAPRKGFYVVEIVYTKGEKQTQLNSKYIAGIDLGVNNLVALTSDMWNRTLRKHPNESSTGLIPLHQLGYTLFEITDLLLQETNRNVTCILLPLHCQLCF